jgi:hypothetical protein
MPLFAYFSVVGSALLGLLFLYDAMSPPREPMKLASDFQGLSSMRAQASVPTRPPALVAVPEPARPSQAIPPSQAIQPPQAIQPSPAVQPSPTIKFAATETGPADARPAETPSTTVNLEPTNQRGTSFDVGVKKHKPVARKRAAREAYAQGDDWSWDRSWDRPDRSWNRSWDRDRSWDRSWDRGGNWSGYNRGYGDRRSGEYRYRGF